MTGGTYEEGKEKEKGPQLGPSFVFVLALRQLRSIYQNLSVPSGVSLQG
jgi:hypothetical protein